MSLACHIPKSCKRDQATGRVHILKVTISRQEEVWTCVPRVAVSDPLTLSNPGVPSKVLLSAATIRYKLYGKAADDLT